MPDSGIDWARLNEAERTALDLLAQGHTAKSIAALIGRTEGAVNERLREARRKTGIGSSRELARLLRAQRFSSPQENRDEQIGVAATAASDPSLATPAAPRGAVRKGWIAMALIAIGGIAAALFLMQQPVSHAAPDPLLEGLLPDDATSPRRLHDLVRCAPRDPAWAPQAEAAVIARYAAIPRLTALRVTCAETLCEVAGIIVGDRDADVDATMALLQGKALRDAMLAIGFGDAAGMGFGGKDSRAGHEPIYAYWPRAS